MAPSPDALKLTVMVQGLDIEPWGISAKLNLLKLGADIRTRRRPRAMGHLAVLRMLTFQGQAISPLLAEGHPEASTAFQELIKFLAAHTYGVQVVVHENEKDETVNESVEIAPSEIRRVMPTLYRMGSVMAFVRSQSTNYIMRY